MRMRRQRGVDYSSLFAHYLDCSLRSKATRSMFTKTNQILTSLCRYSSPRRSRIAGARARIVQYSIAGEPYHCLLVSPPMPEAAPAETLLSHQVRASLSGSLAMRKRGRMLMVAPSQGTSQHPERGGSANGVWRGVFWLPRTPAVIPRCCDARLAKFRSHVRRL
jgi:hypothetical protein